MEAAINELVDLAESILQAAALLANENVDKPSSSKRASTSLNVVALGDVGAGKSAVLNSLIGQPMLPTGENGVTRAPVSIDIQRDSSLNTKSIVVQIDNETQQVSASALRHSLQDKLSKGASSKGCGDEICLKIRTSTAPPLKLIDLPGLDERIMDDSMIGEYAEHNDAILLVVVPASQAPEISSSRALRLAKSFDADGTRTIGVISKLDQPSSDQKTLAAVQALLLNQGPGNAADIPWVTLIGQSVSIASQSGFDVEYYLETAWRAESERLKSIMTGAPQSKLGRVALVETLVSQIRKHMKVRPPNLPRNLPRIVVASNVEKRIPVRIEDFEKGLIFADINLLKYDSLEALRVALRPSVNPSDEQCSIQVVFTANDKRFEYSNDEDLTGKLAKRLFKFATNLEVQLEPPLFPVARTVDKKVVVCIKNHKNRIYTTQANLSRFPTLEALRTVLRRSVKPLNPQCRIEMVFTVKDKLIVYFNDQDIPPAAAKNLYEIATRVAVELEKPLSPPRASPTQMRIENFNMTVPRNKRKMRAEALISSTSHDMQQQQRGIGAQPPSLIQNPPPVTTTEKPQEPPAPTSNSTGGYHHDFEK